MVISNKVHTDFLIIGAGMAGASLAAKLSLSAKVAVLEMEASPGYHTTGRSAAVFAPLYGPRPVRALTRASRNFFLDEENIVDGQPLVKARDVLMIANKEQDKKLTSFYEDLKDDSRVSLLNEIETQKTQPLLKSDYSIGSVLDSSGFDIDVGLMHQLYLKRAKLNGCTIFPSESAKYFFEDKSRWRIHTEKREIVCSVVVNAAGAWANEIGKLAGAEDIGLVPKRRTALLVDPPYKRDIAQLPITIDIEELFYLKPEAASLLISPADETPSDPCDVQPEEIDVAICVDRIEAAFALKIELIRSKWAGLRSFVSDKSPVADFSGKVGSFFWLAGQGGYGIQTAPALADFSCSLLLGKPVSEDLLLQGVLSNDLSIKRLTKKNR